MFKNEGTNLFRQAVKRSLSSFFPRGFCILILMVMMCVPCMAEEINPAISPTEVLAKAAPKELKERLRPGNGFFVEAENPVNWQLLETQQKGKNQWVFSYGSSENFKAVTTVELNSDYSAAVCQTTLINTGDSRSMPIKNLWSMRLTIDDIKTTPRVLSCGGGGHSAHPEWYPPRGAFRNRYHLMHFPNHNPQITFEEATEFSSNFTLPIIMVSPDIEWDAPGLFFGQEWSAPWNVNIRFDNSLDGLVVEAGPKIKDVVLESGESIELPAVHIGFFENGFEGGSNACRRYIRDVITPRYKSEPVLPPVSYTIWPGLVAPYIDKELYQQAEVLADLGVELFLLDDAWYPEVFPTGVGNWYPDPKKFPNGMEPFAEYVQSKGMRFGLFFDFDCAEPGTKELREHPEFYYEPPARTYPYRQRRLYNYGLPEACAYRIKVASDFVERYGISYIRWDHNICGASVMEQVDPTGKVYFNQLKGLYGVWDALNEKYPQLMIESCAGGGRRLDLGSMKRTHTAWANDDSSHPHIYHTMQLGGNVFLPANYIGSALGWKFPSDKYSVRHTDAGLTDISFLSRMAGTFFLHGRVTDWPDDARARAKHWIKVYKKIRHLLMKDYYRLLAQPQSEADWDAGQFCDGAQEGVVFVFRWAGPTNQQKLILRSLDADGSYSFRNEKTGQRKDYSGKQLMTDGLPVALDYNSAKLYSYKRIIGASVRKD